MSRDSESQPEQVGTTPQRHPWWSALVMALLLPVGVNLHSRDPLPPGRLSGPASQPPRGFGCTIQNNNSGTVLAPGANGDVLFKFLMAQKSCPENALVFRHELQQTGLTLHPAMVANRGYHNPLPAGSYSFFEAVTGTYPGQNLSFGEFFFGHFTAASIDNTALTSILSPQQAATSNNLLLESVVWDPGKGMFNFYEIRGNGESGVWFYRGDSLDILKDIANLDRNSDPSQLLFGEAALGGPRLRCSGCHMNGGPIMKELELPHDSWWRKERPLPLGAMRIAPELKEILDHVVDAGDFATWIKAGDAKLLASRPYMRERGERTLQEQLRPLFCEQEVNLESDTEPFNGPDPEVRAAVGFFVDPRLLPREREYVTLKKSFYTSALVNFNSLFLDFQAGGPRPTDQIDADHAFETPVKSRSDMELVHQMVATGLITEKFAFDVLGVDMTRPMFSPRRCTLLQLLPGKATPQWLEEFKQRLGGSSLPGARELLANLQDPARNPEYYRRKAEAVIAAVQSNAAQQSAVTGYVRLLAERRIAVFQDQISQHPQGQIFEPEFRLIFPTMQLLMKDQQEIAYGGVPGQYWLNPETGLVELSR
jgi:hypothetical protein